MRTFPDDPSVLAALALAVRAPSVHNTQPWRFEVGTRQIALLADPGRRLTVTDPDGRDLLISCGAALHHLRVALAALGWLPLTRRLPDQAEPDRLAIVQPTSRTGTRADLALAVSIPRRRTDRRRYLPRAVPMDRLDELIRVAAAEGGALRVIGPGPAHDQLVSAIAEADQRQRANPAYAYELARWTGRRLSDGVPTEHRPQPGLAGFPAREFSPSRLREPVAESDVDGLGTLLVLGTSEDNRLSRLRAGEAASAVLLNATRMGLATCPLTQPLEVSSVREDVRLGVLGGLMVPQLVLRIGWAPSHPDMTSATSRMPVAEVVDWVVP
jgi:nitroreductase